MECSRYRVYHIDCIKKCGVVVFCCLSSREVSNEGFRKTSHGTKKNVYFAYFCRSPVESTHLSVSSLFDQDRVPPMLTTELKKNIMVGR